MKNSITVCGYPLLDVRLWFYFVAFVHLSVTAVVSLSIDTTVDEDPSIKMYMHVRWKLITCWFNLIMLAYFPLCLYCDWRMNRGFDTKRHVKVLKHIGDVVMTSILVPTTMVADILFWAMMNADPGLLAPPKLFNYLPYWCQHSMHSVSMVVVMIDLVITPRRRPKNLVPRLTVMTTFFTTYFIVVYTSYLKGELVYAVMDKLTSFQLTVLVLSCYVGYVAFFMLQWKFIEFLWEHDFNYGAQKVKK